jgi:hypothetical protein
MSMLLLPPPSPEPDMLLLSWSDSGDSIHLDSTPPPVIGFFAAYDVIPDTGSLAKCKCAEVDCDKKPGASYGSDKKPKARYRAEVDCDKKPGASYGSDKKPKARYRVDPPGETAMGDKEPDFGDYKVGPRAYNPGNNLGN